MKEEEMKKILDLWDETARKVLGVDYPEDILMGFPPKRI